MDSFSDRLRNAREKRGMSQEALATRAGVSQSTISALELDPTRKPRDLLKLAKVLMVSPDWLQSGKGPREPAVRGEKLYVAAESLDELAERLLDLGPEEVGRLMALLLRKQAERR
ncbi:helix-turn-helix domain-containing protein [Chromobacterium sp. CV08]|uniref:helix-turn-helix domain-containing protein n=1 Tax=Chromobacterium sp. CV08 TaxID=3133274 RepID=UPI003DA9212A